MTTWIVVIGAAAVTYLLRASVLVAGGGRRLPAGVESRMRFVGPAVLAALVTGALFVEDGAAVAPPVGEVAALAVAALVVHRTHKPVHALVVGLPLAWAAAALGG